MDKSSFLFVFLHVSMFSIFQFRLHHFYDYVVMCLTHIASKHFFIISVFHNHKVLISYLKINYLFTQHQNFCIPVLYSALNLYKFHVRYVHSTCCNSQPILNFKTLQFMQKHRINVLSHYSA